MVNLLSVRLRAEYWFRKHPEILEQELYPPVVIMGLQRTGTTKLQRLLAADPDNRVLKSWEAINPAPLQKELNGSDRRIRAAQTSEKALRKMAPGFFAIHPVESGAPEEDILLLDVTFLSTTPEAITHVPSYARWLEETDQDHAYAYGSKLLRFLQWQRPGKRWVLKSPHHLEFLDLVEKHYGEALYLWTHRDLAECIPSFLSMVCHSRALFSNEVDMEDVVGHWTRKISYMLEKGLKFRDELTRENAFLDILYEDLVSCSMDELETIYGHLGGIRPDLKQLFLKAETLNPKGKYGSHAYHCDTFGISRDSLITNNPGYVKLYESLRQSIPNQP
jgi:hypothetical protein